MFTRMSSTHSKHKDCWQTFVIYVINDQLQLCIHSCSNDVKKKWQQCWYHLPIQIIYPKDVLSHMQTISNHMGLDLESRMKAPEHPSPNTEPNFAHHSGNAVLHCAGAKRHHTPAVPVVYSKQPDLSSPARVRSHLGHWPLYQLSRDGQAQVHFRAPWLRHAIFFLGDVGACHSAPCHFRWWSNECMHASSTIKMQSRNALLSFLQCCRWVLERWTHIALWSGLSTCGMHCPQTFCFPKLLMRKG